VNEPPTDRTAAFVDRHIGSGGADQLRMLETLGCASLDQLTDRVVPEDIRLTRDLDLPPARSEHEALEELRRIAGRNRVFRSLIGMGYSDCITPPVIQRNVLENPGWYTQYTPYQAEISQGRLEALLNFQQMVADLTGLPLANASLLDEATAAAEAMTLCQRAAKGQRRTFYVADDCHPQNIAVVQTRAAPLGIRVLVSAPSAMDLADPDIFGVLLQYPTSDGRICDYGDICRRAHAGGALVAVATDLLALTLIKPPGELGADVAVGNSQRFGVPLGYGGPHAAFMAMREQYARQMPGRIIGVSRDAAGRVAYRLAVQTREQHIRREKATSNICTAQALLAIMASMYAVYHGPRGLRAIAQRVHALTTALRSALERGGAQVDGGPRFDTLRVRPPDDSAAHVISEAENRGLNLRDFGDGSLGIALDERTTVADLRGVCAAFGAPATTELEAGLTPAGGVPVAADAAAAAALGGFARSSDYLTHAVFNTYHSEHELLRYLHRLQSRDLSLTTSMIPLGSCTMKLNATAEMLPISWPEFAGLHPYAPRDQAEGYAELFAQLARWLAEITGLAAVSLQPNAGAQGEYAGLLAIRAYHLSCGDARRDVCLIPVSAHGTNPASATLAGLRVVAVQCDDRGDVDVEDLRRKAESHRDALAALMITYPSTHGVFEVTIREICAITHENGGLVYMDGANMNAQVGLCRPGDMGADVVHLNLHKTFCIPHGGGGPGMGPIAVTERLAPFLPLQKAECRMQNAATEDVRVPASATSGDSADSPSRLGPPAFCIHHSAFPVGPVAAAPWGSASILPISWAYIAMMGAAGLRQASQVAILNANYMAKRLEEHYDVLYKGHEGRVAHEFILDLRPFKKSAGVEPEDVAKRLMDFGFHAPTMSWPVPGTLMIEPTESESKAELDRFCDALIAIRAEMAAIERGEMDRGNNPLTHAPHTALDIASDDWRRPYSREQAAFPAPWTRAHKYWPPVGRIDNVWGDRNLFCLCPPVEDGA